MIKENFNLREWQEEVRTQRMMAATKVSSDERLKRCLCVVDAKSLYDHLVKETVGSAEDHSTAIERQMIRQSMNETRASIRWVPHPRMCSWTALPKELVIAVLWRSYCSAGVFA